MGRHGVHELFADFFEEGVEGAGLGDDGEHVIMGPDQAAEGHGGQAEGAQELKGFFEGLRVVVFDEVKKDTADEVDLGLQTLGGFAEGPWVGKVEFGPFVRIREGLEGGLGIGIGAGIMSMLSIETMLSIQPML